MTVIECSLMAGPFLPVDRKCDWCGNDLPFKRTRWCSDKCSKEFTRNHRWSWARKAAKRRDGYRCVRCGSRENLEVHHVEPCHGAHGSFSCKHHIEGLVTLCKTHHKQETDEHRRIQKARAMKQQKRRRRVVRRR